MTGPFFYPWDNCRIEAGTVCEKHGGEYIIVEPVAGGRKYFCAACLFELIHGMSVTVERDHIVLHSLHDVRKSLLEEITRLERRFLEETKAHDKTRHRLHCRELELERLRSNMYKERVEESQNEAADAARHEEFVNEFDPFAAGARIMVKKKGTGIPDVQLVPKLLQYTDGWEEDK